MSSHLIEKISSEKKGCSKGTEKANESSAKSLVSKPASKPKGGSKGTDKLKESPANLLAPNQPSDGQKSGSRIKVQK